MTFYVIWEEAKGDFRAATAEQVEGNLLEVTSPEIHIQGTGDYFSEKLIQYLEHCGDTRLMSRRKTDGS